MRSTLTLTPGTLASVASLTALASTGKVSPIINTVRLEFTRVALEGAPTRVQLVALATDRYTAGRLTVPDVGDMETDDDTNFESATLPVALLADVARAVKSARLPHSHPSIALTIEREPGGRARVTFALPSGATLVGEEEVGNFPPVGRLFKDAVADIPQGSLYNPELLGRLAKLRLPADAEERPAALAKTPWEFLGVTGDSEKSPMLARRVGTPSATASTLDVLIQPNLRAR